MPCSCVPVRDLHDVAGLVARIGLLVRQRLGDGVGDVLDQLAAQHDVQELLAAADAEHRLVLRSSAPLVTANSKAVRRSLVITVACRAPPP